MIVHPTTLGWAGVTMLTIGGGGSYGLRATGYVYLMFCFEYCLECSEIDISVVVVFFGTEGGGM